MGLECARGLLAFVFSLFMLMSVTISPGRAADAPTQTAGAVQERIAKMSDEDARKLLITQLQEQASVKSGNTGEAPGPAAALGRLLHMLDRQSDSSQGALRKIIGSIPLVPPELYRIFVGLSADGTLQGALMNVLRVLFFIALGLTVEKAGNSVLEKKITQIVSDNLAGKASEETNAPAVDKIAGVLAFMLPSMVGLTIFTVTASLSYFAFAGTTWPAFKLFFLVVLLTITVVRGIAILAGSVLSPTDPRLRLLPLSNAVAAMSYRFLVWTWGYIVSFLLFLIALKRLGATEDTVALLKIAAATVLLAVTAGVVVVNRNRISQFIVVSSPGEGEVLSWQKRYLASLWHILALCYLITLWILMIANVTHHDTPANGAFILSFFVLPIWMLADRLVQWLVKEAMLGLKLSVAPDAFEQAVEEASIPEQHSGDALFRKVRYYARLALLVAVLLWVADLWGYDIPLVSSVSGVLFDTLIIMTLALLFWKFVSSWIERKIKESLPEEPEKKDDADDDWGTHTAQGRAYTLLPIIRSFIASILVIMVTLTILSSMGVDIGPLLAGAGVVGLAIGFGAQKIVSDIFSGVFYLFDDAFRVGEYLTAGSVTGTVEKISLRNIMLRHHRGMLQIIPYSELGTITNYMRGGIIEKFNLDFPYDADIEKIRKIIKKVGLEMLEDPELAKDFIRPIKSQGVREITNSVMTIRVKFTAKPGSQFVIRREAFKRITAAMQAKGIHYAHRKVIVDMPVLSGTGNGDPGQIEKIAQAGGAAARQIFDEEEKLKQQAAEGKSEK